MIAFSSIFGLEMNVKLAKSGLEMLKYSLFFALDLKFIPIFALSLNKMAYSSCSYLLS